MIGVSTVGGTTVQETSVLLKASICLDDCVTLLRDKNNNIKDALSAIDLLISVLPSIMPKGTKILG